MRQHLLTWVALAIGVVVVFYAGNFAWQKLRPHKISGAPFITQTVDDLTVNLANREGELRKGDNEAMIEFRDRNGQLVDVGAVDFKIDMNMPGMEMHGGATVERTRTTGQYRARLKIDMSGDWNARVSYQGPKGNGQTNFPVNVKP